MQLQEFEAIDKVAGKAYDKCEAFLLSPEMEDVRKAIQKLSAMHPKYSFELNCTLEVFDESRGHMLPIFHAGVWSCNGAPTVQHFADSSVQKYWCRGAICAVPHNYCPACWGSWDFKFKHGTCPECGVQLGKEVKYFLDSDQCPFCEQGRITRKEPKCSRCDFAVNPDGVMWG